MNGLYKKYGELKVLDGFDLHVAPGEVNVLLGPSGCGKTSLLNILAGTVLPDAGNVRGTGEKGTACMFQDSRLLPWLTVSGNIKLVIKHLADADENEQLLQGVLSTLGLSDHAGHYPAQLSGGLARRAALARALVYPSPLMLLDEPFSGLDISLKKRIIKDFSSLLSAQPRTVVMVTHDVYEALLLADVMYVLEGPPLKIKSRLQIGKPRAGRDLSGPFLSNIEKKVLADLS